MVSAETVEHPPRVLPVPGRKASAQEEAGGGAR